MTDSRQAGRRQARAPLGRRTQRRWAIVGGVALCWLFAELITGSAVIATVLLVAIAGLGVACVAGLRAMGITRDHPALRRMATRPWRDGQDVLKAAIRHLSDVFIVTPSGSLIAPDVVELQMNPGDLAALCERMELDVVSTSVTELYQDQVAERGARFAGAYRPEVYVVQDDSIPQGRFRLRRGLPASAYSSPSAGPRDLPDLTDRADRADSPEMPDRSGRQFTHVAATALDEVSAGFAPEWGYIQPGSGRTIMDGAATVMEQIRPVVPVLRLVTGSSVTETSLSGARAGRGPVELVLPDVPTVSREHARFTFSAGQWWVTNQGRNGLHVNGVPVPVAGEQPLNDGDSIRWGTSPDAPLSRVEIG